jgi:uncharacterized membrane protein
VNIKNHVTRYARRFSFVGLAIGTMFFAASVTPSLLPRHFGVQGLLSGCALAVGYGVGVASVGIYHFLRFTGLPRRVQRIGIWITTGVVAVVFIAALRQMTFWQNSIRKRMDMPAVETSDAWLMLLIAILSGLLLIVAARIVISLCTWLAACLNRYIPRRVAILISGVVVGMLFLVVGEGVIARGLLAAADRVFLYADGLIDEGVAEPTSPLASGSQASLIEWDSIGRYGKEFLVSGPRSEEISDLLGRDAFEPIRVYVGIRSADTNQERAELALKELKRVGAFERSALIITTPTGTGWLDPGSVDTVEYLLGGDTAIVSMQYSYLPSWITILVDPERSIASAEALFDAIYGYWTTLPDEDRPKLYLHGLSLGALGGELAADLISTFEDPIDGAVFSGAPFPSRQWARIVAERNRDSPEWLPTFRDGRLVRFWNQYSVAEPDRPWGPIRYVYIQYASDPLVFFSPTLLYRKPNWLVGERGPDVSPHLRWYPFVTFLQVGFDIPMTATVPRGYGHNYAPDDYIDAWLTVTDPPNWTVQTTARLKARFQPQ